MIAVITGYLIQRRRYDSQPVLLSNISIMNVQLMVDTHLQNLIVPGTVHLVIFDNHMLPMKGRIFRIIQKDGFLRRTLNNNNHLKINSWRYTVRPQKTYIILYEMSARYLFYARGTILSSTR